MSKRITVTRDSDFQPVQNTENDGFNLEGYAAVFSQPTRINSFEGNFTETISRGAFSKTLSENTPICQFQHGRDSRTGSVPIGVFTELSEDDHGLKVKARMFDNDTVLPVRQAIEAGAIQGMSFAFQVIRDSWADGTGNPITGRDLQKKLFDTRDGDLYRIIKEVRLSEAGPVTAPAYAGTSVNVRSAEDLDATERDEILASYMRSSGLKVESDDLDRWLAAENIYRWLTAEAEFRTAPEDEAKPVEPNGDTWASEGGAIPEEDERAADPKKPYGPVSYADPGLQADKKKRYPIDTAEHVKAALSYIGQADNAAKYSSEDLAKVKAKIHAAAKKMGIGTTESKSDSTEAAERSTSAVTEITGKAASSTLPSTKEEINRAKPVLKTKVSKIMTLQELREHLATISVRAEELNTEFRDAELPEAEQAEFDAITADRSATEAKIVKIESRLSEFKAAATEPKRTERGTDTPAYIRKTGEEIFDIDAIRRDSMNDGDFTVRLRDNALRATESAKFGGGRLVNREDAQGQIEYFLDDKDDASATFAKRVLVTGAPAYERAWAKAVASGNPSTLFGEEARALSLGSDGGGGYAVPVQLDPTVILTNNGTIDPLRSIARVEQIVGKEWQGITSAGTTVSRSAEGAEAGDNSFTLAQKTVRTNRVTGFVPFSYELAESWGQVRSEITRALADAKAREEASSFVLGDGSTGQQPGGVVGSLSGNTVTAAGTAAFAAADLYALEVALAPRWRAQGKFLAHRAIYNKARQFDTAGGAQLWERIGAGLPSQLLGYDALESSETASVLTTGSKIALFGDFQNFLIVDRIGMSVELIPQVFHTDNNRPTGQRGIFAIWMNNSKILVDAAFKLLVTG